MSTGDAVPSFGASEADLPLIGPALRLLRRESGLPQNVVAYRAGITKAMLSSYETGKSLPNLGSLVAVLRELRCDFRRLQDTLDRLRLGSSLDRASDGGAPLRLECEVGRAVLDIVARLTRDGERANLDQAGPGEAPA